MIHCTVLKSANTIKQQAAGTSSCKLVLVLISNGRQVVLANSIPAITTPLASIREMRESPPTIIVLLLIQLLLK